MNKPCHFTLAALGTVLLVTGCGSEDRQSPGGSGDNVSLDNQAAVHDSVTVAGKVLTTTSHGVTYTLTIPAGAVKVPAVITMTPVLGIDSLKVAQLIGGVDLEPQGLVLGKAATLKITVAHSAPAGTVLIGFGYEGDGNSLGLNLPADSGAFVNIPIHHFSGGGAAFATLGQIQALFPRHQLTNQVRDYIDSLMVISLNDPRDFAAELNLMREWFSAIVLPGIQNASNDVALLRAMSEFDFWRGITTPSNIIEDDPVFQPQRDSFAAAALPKLQQAIADNNSECGETKDLGFANNVLYWQTVAADLGLGTAGNGLDRTSVLAGLCIEVAFLHLDYPDPATVGQPHSLDVETELRFRSDGSLLIQPFSFNVVLTGTSQPGPITGFSDPLGNFTAVVTPASEVITIGVTACLFTPTVPYADVCGVTGIARGATDLTGLWTGNYHWNNRLVPIEVHVTQTQNAVHGSYSVPVPGGPSGTISGTLANDTLFNFAIDQATPCLAEFTVPFARVVQGEIRVPRLTNSGCDNSTSLGMFLGRSGPAPVQGLYVGTESTPDDPTPFSAGVVMVQFGDTVEFEGISGAGLPQGSFSIVNFGAILVGGALTQGANMNGLCTAPTGNFARRGCVGSSTGGAFVTGSVSGTHLQVIMHFATSEEDFDLTRQ